MGLNPAARWSWHGVRGPLAGMVHSSIVVGPLVFAALVALGGSCPLAFMLLAVMTLVASVSLLRMRAAAG